MRQYANKKDWIKEKIKGDIKRSTEMNENDNTMYQNFWDAASKSSNKRDICIIIGLSQEAIEIPDKQPNITFLKETLFIF